MFSASKVRFSSTARLSPPELPPPSLLFGWGTNDPDEFGSTLPHVQMDTSEYSSDPAQLSTKTYVGASPGRSMSLFLRSDGKLCVCGWNLYGQLGDGTIPPAERQWSKIKQIGNENYRLVSAGYLSSYAIREDGKLFAWGQNDKGQLGIGNFENRNAPVQVTDFNWVAVSAGTKYLLAIRDDGRLFAWGDNARGQLGDGSEVVGTPAAVSSLPVQVVGDDIWLSVSAGDDHSLAIRSDGKLFGWGYGSGGKLGLGGITGELSTPVKISDDRWISVSAGYDHSLALREDGKVFAFGRNYYGQIGNGKTSSGSVDNDQYSPLLVADNMVAVGAGLYSSFAIGDDGRLFSWGDNRSGLLGVGLNTRVSYRPVLSSPTVVGGDSDWVAIRVNARSNHALALKSPQQPSTLPSISSSTISGSLFGWGYNRYGQVGDGTTTFSPSGNQWTDRTTPVQINDTNNWKLISSGQGHSLAIRDDDKLFAWGENSGYALGVGSAQTQDRASPTEVVGSILWKNAIGGEEYSLALNQEDKLFGWGTNDYGQLGNGRYEGYWGDLPIQQPVQSSIYSWRQVATSQGSQTDDTTGFGQSFSMGIRNDGKLFAWGFSNSLGGYPSSHFGDETLRTTDSRLVSPAQVGDDDWFTISCGMEHVLGIRSDGKLFAWGSNLFGQLGCGAVIYNGYTGNSSFRSTPSQVTNHTWKAISAGRNHSLALRSDGKLFSWGRNGSGQVGDGTTVIRSVPVQITDYTWAAIATGHYHSLAIRDDGKLFAWGENNKGQLGVGDKVDRTFPVQVGTDNWLAISAGFHFSVGIKANA